MTDSFFSLKVPAFTNIATVLVKNKLNVLSDNIQDLISQKNLPLGITHLILFHIRTDIVGFAYIVQTRHWPTELCFIE